MLTGGLESLKKALASRYENYFGLQPLARSHSDIDQWFASPLGQRVLAEEKAKLDLLLPEMFGYHLMQLSVLDTDELLTSSPVSYQFAITSTTEPANKKNKVQAEFEQLPITDNSIDVSLLHHALDFSYNPHQLLREAARVTIPNGHIVLIGFNPWSMMGAVTPMACLLSKSTFYRRNHLRLARLHDWFKVLELETVYSDRAYYGWPCNRYYAPVLEKIGSKLYPFWGSFYILVLRKNITPMTMIKTSWKTQKVLPKWGKGIATSSATPVENRIQSSKDHEKR